MPSTEPPSGDTATSWPDRARELLSRRGVKLAVLGVVVAGALLVLVTGALFTYYYTSTDIPDASELALPDPTVVYDAAGDRVATLDPAAVHRNLELQELPDLVPQAVMAAEDREFYSHGGFSVTGIVRAAWANVTAGGIQEGASTIDQQYVEVAVQDVGRSLLGKLKEVAVATKLDRNFSKDKILEMYLNAVPFGRGARGVQAAAQTYFRVDAADLDVNQAATLAGMIAAPSAFDPARHPDEARARRDYVLEGMAEQGWLERDRAQQLIGSPLPEVETDPLVQYGPDAYFLDAVRSRLPALLEQRYADDLYSGLAVHTTLDRRMQRLAVEQLDEVLDETGYAGAVTSIDPASGAVRVVVGGRDYAQQPFNVVTQAVRQAGSSFKPIALTAFVEQGHAPSSKVDAPEILRLDGGEVEIRNYSRRGYDDVTVRDATINSINTAYVNIARAVGFDTVADTAKMLGIDRELPEVATLTLGSGSVSPLDMAEAYATLAAGGTHHEPVLVTRVETHTGEVAYEHEDASEMAVNENTAAVVTDVLRDVVQQGTGTGAQIGRPVAGKTGTTNDYRDAWFVGYAPQLATAVWVGNLDNSPTEGEITGGSLPATIWSGYMSAALEPLPVAEFPEPDFSVLEELDELSDDEEDRSPPARTPTSPSPSPSPSASPSPSPSPSPSAVASPTGKPSPSPTSSPSGDPSPSPEPSPTSTSEPSPEPSPTATSTSDPSPEPSPTATSTTSSSSDGGGSTTSGSGSGDASPEPSPSPS